MKISKKDYLRIRCWIIKKLYRANKWKSNHILVENIISGYSKHELHKLRLVLIILVKQEYLILNKSLHGDNVALNPAKIKEINNIIVANK